MKYKSPYRTAILVKERDLKEKERELFQAMREKTLIQEKLDMYQQRTTNFYQMLEQEREVEGHLLGKRIDKKGEYALKVLMKDIEDKIRVIQTAYNLLKTQLDKIKEMDINKEKEFKKAQVKKEQKMIEGVMLMKKQKKGGN